jgi:hypothetical protein
MPCAKQQDRSGKTVVSRIMSLDHEIRISWWSIRCLFCPAKLFFCTSWPLVGGKSSFCKFRRNADLESQSPLSDATQASQ